MPDKTKRPPLFSVVTPSYNQGAFIEDNILSVLRQGFADFEHIVVDAGSTDGTLDVLRKYSHLKWASEPDRGQSHGLNKGFERARGQWILWLNADDYLAVGALERFAAAVALHPAVDFIYGHTHFVDERNILNKTVFHLPFDYALLVFGVYCPPSTGTLFRASRLKENPLSEEFHLVMDTEWYLRVGAQASGGLVDAPCVVFRVGAANKTSENIKSGIVNPRHARERELYRDRHILPWRNALPRHAAVILTGERYLQWIRYYRSKLKYLPRLVEARREYGKNMGWMRPADASASPAPNAG